MRKQFIDTVKEMFLKVKEKKHDAEVAHSLEHDLWGRVLSAISKGAENPHLLAREAIKTRLIKFPRWFA